MRGPFAFEKALKGSGISFICEVKKASPSKGIIAQDFPYTMIACEYAEAGANAISVLTEPGYFLGSDAYLRRSAGSLISRYSARILLLTSTSYGSRSSSRRRRTADLRAAGYETLAEYIGICDELGLPPRGSPYREEIRSALEATRVIGVTTGISGPSKSISTTASSWGTGAGRITTLRKAASVPAKLYCCAKKPVWMRC